MKKSKYLYISIMLITILYLVAGASDETPTPNKEYTQEEVNIAIKKMDDKFKTLGFKGLHLGMSYDDVNELVKETPWAYGTNVMKEKSSHLPQYKKFNQLCGDNSTMGKTWDSIGCRGEGETKECFEISSTTIKFYNDKLYEIVISSPISDPDEIQYKLLDWAGFALKGLMKKYGKPTKIYIPLKNINVFAFRTDFYYYLYEWDLISKQKIILTIARVEYISEDWDSFFSCDIRYQGRVPLCGGNLDFSHWGHVDITSIKLPCQVH